MSEAAVEGASRPSRRLLYATLAVWALIALAAPLLALMLDFFSLGPFPLGFWVTAQGALIALPALAYFFARRAGGASSGEGWRPPMALAGEALGGASIIGFTGAIAALGYDGLALPLGLVAGLALMAIAIAPRFVLYPSRSVSGFFAARFDSAWPRRSALVVALVAATLILAADLRAGALAVQALAGAEYALAAAFVTLGVASAWLLRSLYGRRRVGALVYVALLLFFTIGLVALAAPYGRFPIPYWGYGGALRDLSQLEQKLVIDKLSEVRALRPMASPFLQASMANFLGFVLAIALGIAALPHLLGRHASQAATSPGDASRRVALAAAWTALLLIGLAAYAVFARLGVAGLIARGLESTLPPAEFIDARGYGWLDVCGPNAGQSIAEACAKVPGHRGFLRMQDLTFNGDAFAIAAPYVTGAAGYLLAPLWAAVTFAALAGGGAILDGLLDADGEARSRGGVAPRSLDARSVAIAVVALLAAALLAVAGRIEIPSLISEGLALLASALFPPLLMGLYWRRFGSAGAVAAAVTGFALAAIYISGVRLFPTEMYEWTGALSDAAPGAIRKFETLRQTLDNAGSQEAQTIAADVLRRHAATIANLWGLKPAAVVLLAVPLAFIAGISMTLIRGKPQS